MGLYDSFGYDCTRCGKGAGYNVRIVVDDNLQLQEIVCDECASGPTTEGASNADRT